MDFEISLPYLMLIFLCLSMLAFGVYFSRRESKDQNVEGFILAKRQLPTAVAMLSMMATWVGGGYINGTAEAVYNSDLGVYWAQAPFGYALSLIVGGLIFAPKMRRRKYTTLLDPFAQRYGKKMAAILFIPALIGEIFWSAAILVALGTTCGLILDLNFQFIIILSATVMIAYTMFGGLYSVAYTDMIQLPLIFIGLAVAIPSVVAYTGGPLATFESYVETCPSFPVGAMRWRWGDMLFLLIFGGIPWHCYMQRVLSAKTPQAARRLSVFAGFACIFLAIPPIILGMSASSVDWVALNLDPPPSASLVLPYTLKTLTTPIIASLSLGAIVVAVMSSVDSSILAVASLFTWNIYKPFMQSDSTDQKLIRILKLSVLVAGILATALALTVKTVYGLWVLSADLVYVILFPQLVIVLFSKKISVFPAFMGVGIGFVIRLMGGEELLGIPGIFSAASYEAGAFYTFKTFAMLCNLITTFFLNQVFSLKNSKSSSTHIE